MSPTLSVSGKFLAQIWCSVNIIISYPPNSDIQTSEALMIYDFGFDT